LLVQILPVQILPVQILPVQILPVQILPVQILLIHTRIDAWPNGGAEQRWRRAESRGSLWVRWAVLS